MEVIFQRDIAWPELERHESELVATVGRDQTRAFLLVSEPKATFTFGPSSKPSDLLWTNPAARGIEVHPARRGGKWTYHGPGQVVVYPIVHLPEVGIPKRGIRRYLETLAASVQAYLAELGLESELGGRYR